MINYARAEIGRRLAMNSPSLQRHAALRLRQAMTLNERGELELAVLDFSRNEKIETEKGNIDTFVQRFRVKVSAIQHSARDEKGTRLGGTSWLAN